MRQNRSYKVLYYGLTLFCVMFLFSSAFSQPKIVHIQPDAMAPGMTIAMELLAPASDTGAFGADGIYLPDIKVAYLNPLDSNRAIFGPVCVSWRGRVMQIPVLVPLAASTGDVVFQVLSGNRKSDTLRFSIVSPQPIFLNGDGTLDKLTPGNTLVVQSLSLQGQSTPLKGIFRFTATDPDSTLSGNPRYHPIIVLAQQTIELKDIELSVSADGINGGQGGGGGGHGNVGLGGAGYTGGGSDIQEQDTTQNFGSGKNATPAFGGASTTGVRGGQSVIGSGSLDQGGGGGTGCPYGSSGVSSGNESPSSDGSYGGGTGGGEQSGAVYGGGGGGFATKGENGAGIGDNGGEAYGGRFLMPLQGGSAGGAGNALLESDSAGSGGGGGGAIAIVAYDNITFSNSSITAKGANGTSGKKALEAGGGGGSGGGILIGGRNGISFDQSSLEAIGGNGGLGGITVDSISRGGNGALGRIQFQGNVTDTSRFFGVRSSAPIVLQPPTIIKGPFATITGLAGSKNDLTDSIRIYYRDHHSGWRWKDTVRFIKDSKLQWKAELPIGHDALLFVTVFEKVNVPHSSFADYEPAWLTSHLSSAVIGVEPSANLLVQSDTLNFGAIKFDTCITASLRLSNTGEALLTIDSLTITNSKFSIPVFPKTIGLLGTDSLLITYCPTVVGCDTATLIIHSKSGGTKTIVLLGCGIDKDERLIIKPAALNFGRVHVGNCDTLSLIATSVGNDTVTINPDAVDKPPYRIISPTSPVKLGKNDSVRILVTFCPTDSGSFHSSFILTHRRDSILTWGTGTIRILTTPPQVIGGTLCHDECDTIQFLASSVGNDTILFTQDLIGGQILSPQLPFRMPPHSDTEIVVLYCAGSAIDSSIALHFISTSDSAATTQITFHPIRLIFSQTGKTNFGPICLSNSDSNDLEVVRTGGDSLDFTNVHLSKGTVFNLNSQIRNDSLYTHIGYHPSLPGTDRDTLIITILSGKCDSTVFIALEGSATNGGISLSANELDFGILGVDSCKEDSIVIALPCGLTDTLQLAIASAPFQLIDPIDGRIIVSSGSSQTIRFSYCPTLAKKDSLVLALIGSNTDTTLTLSGEGKSERPQPFIRFHLETINGVSVDNEFKYLISIDSIANAEGITSITASLEYDPFVLQARSIQPSQPPQWTQITGSEISPGTFTFSSSGNTSLTVGAFALLSIKPFFNSSSSSTLTLDNSIATPPSIISSTIGLVTVITCPDPPGSRITAGGYHFDGIMANPVTSILTFDATIGAAGPLSMKIYDVMGSLVHESLVENQPSGKHRFEIDVSKFSAGVYNLQLDSWGWLGGTSFVIRH